MPTSLITIAFCVTVDSNSASIWKNTWPVILCRIHISVLCVANVSSPGTIYRDTGRVMLGDNPGLRRHRIKNTSSDFKHTRRPRLVQTEALFDEDGYLSLQERASVWMIRRLCLATRRPCIWNRHGAWFLMRTRRHGLWMFQTYICVHNQLLLSLTLSKNQF